MEPTPSFPSEDDVKVGQAVFADDMPIWLGVFGADVWPFIEPNSPLYQGPSSSSIVWRDYIEGRGATYKHPTSTTSTKYPVCLTPEIVYDLKVAAVIHCRLPHLIKHARSSKKQLDPKTVKGRINDLAVFFSLLIRRANQTSQLKVTRLSEIPFSLLKESIAAYPGRGAHLKRALKLISDPVVQRNLRAPLQWGLLDITKSSINWSESKDEGGIPPLSDIQFLFLLEYCKKTIARFKRIAEVGIHDRECQSLSASPQLDDAKFDLSKLELYFRNPRALCIKKHGVSRSEMRQLVYDAQMCAMLVVLLFTGMRHTETLFVRRHCLKFQHGYWFLNSKEVKHRPKDTPVCEGWLAIDLTRDAYDVLMFITKRTGTQYLFSSPLSRKGGVGYKSLNSIFNPWLKRIDEKGLFSNWSFSIHQCRETLVAQLANQEVGLPFISMQLKHFHSQFFTMPNAVTAGYGKYRERLMTSVTNRIAIARENALLDLYGEDAKFAGGGGTAHKARIDAFFAGLGLFGDTRREYIKRMAERGVTLMPTSIGNCAKNFIIPTENGPPPCYGDYQCDPNCSSHVITDRAAHALIARRQHALEQGEREPSGDIKIVWFGLVEKLDAHIDKLQKGNPNV
ncbi:site-specific integrase [Paraburkholderia sp. Tr-20389]|uniref:tyrosine-type recombinase/integrase n=1 Tax=Paraburkholderia sp. Tr-20389 TaxID=2703903 RepID=UPI0019812F4E|nr:tyrosine-type recombinase/integrase [Paraburkholderia sp. Tr-20389]MBN3757491.1 site-specific integrase [Paraburkholderia sp. Tr-20389]